MRNNKLRFWWVALALWLIATPVVADDAVATETLVDQAITTTTAPAIDEPAPAVPAPVITQTLRDVTADAIGEAATIPQLPIDGWRGTDYEQALRIIGSLPAAVPSPYARQLQVAILTAATHPPARKKILSSSEALLLRQRLEKLWAMGQWTNYTALVAKIPKTQLPMSLAQNDTLARVIAGQTEAACADVNGAARDNPGDFFWHQAQIYCAIKTGQIDQARLWWALWHDRNPQTPRDWQSLVEAVLANKPKTAVVAADSWPAWHWLLALAAELPITIKDASVVKDPLSQIVALNSRGAPAPMKIEWAEGLVLSGAISGRKLGEVYATATTDKASRNVTLERARLWQQEAAITDPVARAVKTADHWGSLKSENEKRWFALSRAPWVKTLGDDKALAFFAPVAARVMVLAGDGPAAQLWLGRTTPDSPETIKNWPLLTLGGSRDTSPPVGMAWADYALGQKPRSFEQSLALLQLLTKALAQNEPALDFDKLALSPSAEALTLQTTQVPSAALTQRVKDATRRSAELEALILSLLGLRGGELLAHGDVALADTIALWRQVGQGPLARDLAREIVVLRE